MGTCGPRPFVFKKKTSRGSRRLARSKLIGPLTKSNIICQLGGGGSNGDIITQHNDDDESERRNSQALGFEATCSQKIKGLEGGERGGVGDEDIGGVAKAQATGPCKNKGHEQSQCRR